MKYALLDHIFKSRPEVLGEEFFNFKKTNSIQEIIRMLEKRLSEFPQKISPNIVYAKPPAQTQQVPEPVDTIVSFLFISRFFVCKFLRVVFGFHFEIRNGFNSKSVSFLLSNL